MEDLQETDAPASAAGEPIDKIKAELDKILTDEVMKAGESALIGWCDDPDVAAYVAFKAMWMAIRTSQKKDKSPSNT
jgi:hypothetical protein